MISHRVIARHTKIFQLRFERLCEDWRADLAEQRKLINHRFNGEDYAEPLAETELERETALRDLVAQSLAAIFARENWIKI